MISRRIKAGFKVPRGQGFKGKDTKELTADGRGRTQISFFARCTTTDFPPLSIINISLSEAVSYPRMSVVNKEGFKERI